MEMLKFLHKNSKCCFAMHSVNKWIFDLQSKNAGKKNTFRDATLYRWLTSNTAKLAAMERHLLEKINDQQLKRLKYHSGTKVQSPKFHTSFLA